MDPAGDPCGAVVEGALSGHGRGRAGCETAFAARTWTLPASAGNNAAFKIRFRLASNRTDETADIGGVVVTGTPVG